MPHKEHAIYIIDGARTPFLKFRGKTGPFTATELALSAVNPLLKRQPFNVEEVDEAVVGCVMPAPNETNIARIIGLRAGLSLAAPAYTVQRNCASGLEALHAAYKDIVLGPHELVLAGGVEAMSYAPLLFPEAMVNYLSGFSRAKKITEKIKKILAFKFKYLKPRIALMEGLTDPVCGEMMGHTAEILAEQFSISREMMDFYAKNSHERAACAHDNGDFDSMEPLFGSNGKVYTHDDGVRANTTEEQLGKLSPFFDRKFGLVTAGNSSQITDGAAFMLIASERVVKEYALKPMAKIVNFAWAGLDPSTMGLGPTYAIAHLLYQQNLTLADIDYFEINEAFAAQVLACLELLKDSERLSKALGFAAPFGEIPTDRLNVSGGAIALGHPVGASGARVVLQLAKTLQTRGAKRGIASLCIGGGQGGAVMLETVES